MKKIIKKISGLILVLAVISILGIYSYNQDSIRTSAEIVSNQKIEWGIKRAQNNEQPDLGRVNRELMQKYNGIAMGNNQDKYVYLTFDMGYEAGYTNSILDVLKENDVKAVFFITAHYLNSSGDIVERMINEGHIVGNHTVNHYSMPEISEEKLKEEVMKLHTTLYEKLGYEMKYIRPPKGEYSEKTLSLTNSYGYTTVMWSFAYDDWDENKQGRTEYAKDKILSNIHPGCVMLLHATSKDNAEILDSIIKDIKQMGYEFKSIDEFKR